MDTVLADVLLAAIYGEVTGDNEPLMLAAADTGSLLSAIKDLAFGEVASDQALDMGAERRVQIYAGLVSALAKKDPAKWPLDVAGPQRTNGQSDMRPSPPAKRRKDHDRVFKHLLRSIHSLVKKDAKASRWASVSLAQGLAGTRRGRDVFKQWMRLGRFPEQDLLYVELMCLTEGYMNVGHWVSGFGVAGSHAEFRMLLLDHFATMMGVATRQVGPQSRGVAREACEEALRTGRGPLVDALREVMTARTQAADAQLEDTRKRIEQEFAAERSELLQRVRMAEDRARVADAEAREARTLAESHARRLDLLKNQRAPSVVHRLRNSVIELVDTLDLCLAPDSSDQPASVRLQNARDGALDALRDLGVRAGRATGLAPEEEWVSAGWYEVVGDTSVSQRLTIARRCFYQEESDGAARSLVRSGWVQVHK